MDAKNLVAEIERVLKEKGMKKAEFYEKSGVSSASLSQWRHNIGFPQRLSLQRINAVLGTNFAVTASEENVETPVALCGGRMMPEEFTARYWALSEVGRAALDQYAQFLQQQEAAAKAKADPAWKASDK